MARFYWLFVMFGELFLADLTDADTDYSQHVNVL
jgi:hypothetical protein